MTSKPSFLLTSAFLVLLQPLAALAQQSQQPLAPQAPVWNCPGPWHMWGGGWGFGWIFPMIVFFLVVAAFMLLARRAIGGSHHWGWWSPGPGQTWGGRTWGDPTHSALQILNERFARGEIQKAEYEEKKGAILSTGPH
jgi:putative membrane protein